MATFGIAKLLLVITTVFVHVLPNLSRDVPEIIKYRASSSVCNFPLGIENGNIVDHQMSTFFVKPGYEPWKGRLNGDGAWWVENGTLVKSLQINFATDRNVTGIQTQGFEDGWVETFQVETAATSSPPYTWTAPFVTDFTGNTDNNTVVQNNFNPVITTRYIQVVVKTYHVAAKMRIEFLGCDDTDDCQSNPCKNGGTCVDGLDSYSCNCIYGFSGDTCEEKATTVELPTTVPVPTTTPITTASQSTTTGVSTPHVPTSTTTQVSTIVLSTTESTDLPTTDGLSTSTLVTTAKATTMGIQTTVHVTANTVTSHDMATSLVTEDVSTHHTTVHGTDNHHTVPVDSGTIGTTLESTSKITVEDSTADTTESSNQTVSQPAASGALIGAIVGGVCAGVVVMTSLVATAVLLHKRKKLKRQVLPTDDIRLV
ncbi:uncharacterized protein LOC144859362 [Branchiostoma floridae x Branchiostoma japonicum]